jgi:hypothetical protein
MAKTTIGILYDFDKTLCTTDMQEYSFIKNLGMTSNEFWGAAAGALPGALVSALISGLALHYLKRYFDKKLVKAEERRQERLKIRKRRSEAEQRRRRAEGRLLFWITLDLCHDAQRLCGGVLECCKPAFADDAHMLCAISTSVGDAPIGVGIVWGPHYWKWSRHPWCRA